MLKKNWQKRETDWKKCNDKWGSNVAGLSYDNNPATITEKERKNIVIVIELAYLFFLQRSYFLHSSQQCFPTTRQYHFGVGVSLIFNKFFLLLHLVCFQMETERERKIVWTALVFCWLELMLVSHIPFPDWMFQR